MAWLEGTLQGDGSYAGERDTATPLQATEEVLQTYRAVGRDALPDSGLAFLGAKSYTVTEYLARRIRVETLAADPDPDLLNGLVAGLEKARNADGGFGGDLGHESTALDTAYALSALAAAGRITTLAASGAVAHLVGTQDAAGAWVGSGGEPSVFVTALAMRALWLARHHYALNDPLDRAQSWILAQRGASVWQDAAETALALLSILPRLMDPEGVRGTLDALRGQQLSDGSWGEDVYATALAVRAVALGARPVPNPDLGTLQGRVLDGDTGLPLAGVELTLDGSPAAGTGPDGRFQLRGLLPGDHTLAFSLLDYGGLTTALRLPVGGVLNLGDLLLVQGADPQTATLRGRVTDADTGLPLADALIATDQGSATTTAADGSFQLAGITPGNLLVSASADGYVTASGSAAVDAGGVFVFLPALVPVSPPGATAALFGQVTGAGSGTPIPGATVTVTGSTDAIAQTDAAGRYRIEPVEPGDLTIRVERTGYGSVLAQARILPGQQVSFSPALSPVEPPPPTPDATLYGRVTDFESGEPVPNATVSVSGATAQSALTDGLGYYSIGPLPQGELGVDFSAVGFRPASFAGLSASGDHIELSVALTPLPPAPSPTTITGTVLDSTTDEPLAGVVVDASYDGSTTTLVTDADGRFRVEAVAAQVLDLGFTLAGYRPSQLALALGPNPDQDIGQVRLRPEGADALLPDLVVSEADRTGVRTDPRTLETSGSLALSLANRGTSSVDGVFRVLVFHDADRDGRFAAAIDTVLGGADVAGGLPAGGSVSLELTLQGQLPFRDAPIFALADSGQAIVESAEDNNGLDLGETCRVDVPAAGNLDPVVKWHWAGSPVASAYNQVMSAPVVAQLSDDNGDGVIDSADTPDIVFTAFAGSYYWGAGVLRGISGSDGSDILPADGPSHYVTARLGPAVGDIDGDGRVEIVVGGPYSSGLKVFENDGSLKWEVPVSGDAQPALADLDSDGTPEIIYGRRVYAPDGSLLWGYAIDDLIPVVADLDLDGVQEIVSNGSAYDAWGTLVWDSGQRGRLGAVGNFDEDPYPEIAITGSGSVTLLNHDGTVVWGPVAVPSRGGGAVTVADVDGDAQPEIGVAGSSAYTVLETDGSLKWFSPTRDYSSAVTGSSVFDFEGDGQAEVLYNDELRFRIYDGETGAVLIDIQNTSGTLWEHPVVADVDQDGHADIVLASNSYAFGGVTGIRVLQDRNNGWVPTRSIWNQHAYHITNINDDGSIPPEEAPSWLTHNTYRLNTFADRDPLIAADLSVALLTLTDNGTGRPFSLGVRVGNGGTLAPGEKVRVAFYQGDPDTAGEPLGELEIADLPAPGFRDVRLDGVTLTGQGAIYAVVDPGDAVEECDESNNRDSIPAVPTAALGELTVGTDAPSYGPNTPVRLLASLANTGSFPSDYRVELSVEDGDGLTIATLAPIPLPDLGPGAATDLEDSWDTGVYLTGDYRLRGLLFDAAGRLLDEAEAGFTITAGDTLLAALDLATQRPVYHTSERVVISARSRNLTVNQVLADLRLELTLETAAGVALLTTTRDVGELVPGGGRDTLLEHDLVAAAEGDYLVGGRLLAADGALLAEAQTLFTVREDLARALTGTVTIGEPSLDQGETQLCTENLRHGGTLSLAAQPVRRLLVPLGGDEDLPVQVLVEEIPLEPGGERTWVRDLDTTGLGPGSYACLLQVGVDGAWVSLDAGAFLLNAPPIAVDAELGLGAGARLLVLLDPGDKDEDQQAAEREFLRSLLDSAGWSYTLVDDADAFTRELYGGGYGLFLLQSASVKLTQETQQVLVEAVNNGAGLVVAGDHDERNHLLDEALGVANQGKHPDAGGISLSGAEPFPPEVADFSLVDHPQRIEPTVAEVLGHYLDWNGYLTGGPAVTGLDYGAGRSLYFAFDLLAEASAGDPLGPFARLMLTALGYVEPEAAAVSPGAVLPFVLTLRNQGIAVAGRAQLSLPPGAAVIDAGGAANESADGLSWPYHLDPGASLSVEAWLRLPQVEAPLDIEALIQIGTASYYADHRRVTLALQPQSPPGLIAALQAMSEPLFDTPRKHLERAEWQLAGGNAEKALKELLKAAGALASIEEPVAVELRRWVDNAIAETAAANVAVLQD